ESGEAEPGETRLLAPAREPAAIGIAAHDIHASGHHRVPGAAELIAAQGVDAGEGGLEPEHRVPAGQYVALLAKRRHVEVVDDILRGHHEPDGLADRHVQLVDLAPPVGMLDLPHPL